MATEPREIHAGGSRPFTLSLVRPVAPHTATRQTRSPLPVLAALALVALSRLLWIGRPTLLVDEAYYWDWSRRLDLGYFDHPPMVAWLIRLFTTLAGSTEFAIRLGSVALAVGTVTLAYKAGTLLGGRLAGWLCLLMTATCPLLVMVSSVATPDGPLLFFWAATVYALLLAVSSGQGRYWYLAGLLLGLALLSKYMAIFLVPSVLLFLVLSGRHWLRRREPYLAGGIALLVFSPNLWWNLRHGWVSLSFQLGHGASQAESGHTDTMQALASYSVAQAGSVGPLLAVLLAVGTLAALVRGLRQRQEALVLLACCTLVIGGFFFLVHGLVYWDAPAYASAIVCTSVLLASLLRQGTTRCRTLLGSYCALAVLSGAAMSAYAIYVLVGGAPLPGPAAHVDVILTERQFPWRQIGGDLDRILRGMTATQRQHVVLLADRYQFAGEIAFYTPGHPLVASGHHQYELWGAPHDSSGPLLFIGDLRKWDPEPSPVHQGTRIVAKISNYAGSHIDTRHLPLQVLRDESIAQDGSSRRLHIAQLLAQSPAQVASTVQFLLTKTLVCPCRLWHWPALPAWQRSSAAGNSIAARTAASAWLPAGMPCVSPRTGLDVCRLQQGDILLNTSRFQGSGLLATAIRDLASMSVTYWFHAGIYDGAGHVLEAGGPNPAHPDREVQATPIQRTGFYGTGAASDATDWVVLRLKPEHQAVIDRAVAWARERAANPGVRFIDETSVSQLLAFGDPRNKGQEARFYCSLFVWRAFAQAGLDLDFNNAPLRFDLPLPLAALLGWQVRADDLYASAFGPFAATLVVQDKHHSVGRLLIILGHYELVMAILGSYVRGAGLGLLAAVGLAGAVWERLCRCPPSARAGWSAWSLGSWPSGPWRWRARRRWWRLPVPARPALGVRRQRQGCRHDRGTGALARCGRSPPVDPAEGIAHGRRSWASWLAHTYIVHLASPWSQQSRRRPDCRVWSTSPHCFF